MTYYKEMLANETMMLSHVHVLVLVVCGPQNSVGLDQVLLVKYYLWKW